MKYDTTIKHSFRQLNGGWVIADPDRIHMEIFLDNEIKNENKHYLAVHDSKSNVVFEGVKLLSRATHIDSDGEKIVYVHFERQGEPGKCFVAIKMENILSLHVLS